MKLASLLLLAIASNVHAATYEMRRVTIQKDQDGKICSENMCILRPTEIVHRTKLGSIIGERHEAFVTTANTVQAHIDQVQGILEPDFTTATKYTNWYVRSSNDSPWKLVRTNVHYKSGENYIRNAEGQSGTFLPTYEGFNCDRNFGD